jgi:hypothetical protein
MPRLIVFPCPNCGASQNVEEGAVSTQCQFCGNTVSVPEELRPKTPQPAPVSMPQKFSFGGAAGMPGMPGMFLNMDLSKLKAMALAARAGDKAQAARLYQESFGVSPEEAMQAAELMAAHHPLVLSNMQMSISPVVQMGAVPQSAPYAAPSPIYNLPSPQMVNNSNRIWRGIFGFNIAVTLGIFLLTACIVLGVFLAIGLSMPGLWSGLGNILGR